MIRNLILAPRDLAGDRWHEPDPLELSRLLLLARGTLVLGRVRRSDACPVDLAGVDAEGWPILVAVLPSGASPAGRLDLLVRLLGHEEMAGLARSGCRIEVHRWGRRGRRRAVEVAEVGAQDSPLPPGPGA